MLIHYKEPSFLEKKEYYQKLVDNIDYKKNKYLYLSSGISNRNNNSIFSTKDESQNNCMIIPKLNPKEKNIKEVIYNSDKNNSFNDSYENINKNNKCFDENKGKDFEESEVNSFENNFNNDKLFYDMINISKNNNNFNTNIYFLDNINYEIADKEENSLYIQTVKNDNNNNIFHLEDIF